MTATISLPPTAEADDRSLPSASSSLRLSLAPAGPAPALLDGAWWPHSRDLGAELPALAAVLDPLWGRITRVTVNPTHWPVVPRKVPVSGHTVKVGWFLAQQDPHELLLLSYRAGRWNLLVIPPQTAPAEAAWLMAAASDPLGTSTASRLMAEAASTAEAPRPPTVPVSDRRVERAASESDRAVEAVWDSEGGHEARDPAVHPETTPATATPAHPPTGR
ncbi:DUF5994 family protein [Streptomyces sp. XY006]|uniref:DUF5994 family protein n=1 Tax=Streptomyces sp. XY006 TaxID=2021410 RepID=UPI000B8C4B8C|nr:DUF5994 family protein [Streptomyces sp. XY006]OXS33875.1 hypothetical protein CHR28_17575 [Streptomyces sp. XY006]